MKESTMEKENKKYMATHLTPREHIEMKKMLSLLSISPLFPQQLDRLDIIKERYEEKGTLSIEDIQFVKDQYEEYR